MKVAFPWHFHQYFILSVILNLALPRGVHLCFVVLICFSWKTNRFEFFSVYLFSISVSSKVKCLLNSYAHSILNQVIFLFIVEYESSVDSLKTSLLSDKRFVNIFSWFVACLFMFLTVLWKAKVSFFLIFMVSFMIFFPFYGSCVFVFYLRDLCLVQGPNFYLLFFFFIFI